MYNATLASNEEYVEGYNLGLELGYMDSYYGRTRNTITPSNGAVIAKATVLANARRGRMNDDRSGRRDDSRRDDSRREIRGVTIPDEMIPDAMTRLPETSAR